MKYVKTITILAVCIIAASAAAASIGIFSAGGPGPFEYETIRGETVTIHGYGLYQHMSADVAVQGIGKDYITLFAAVPLLVLALFLARFFKYQHRVDLGAAARNFIIRTHFIDWSAHPG